MAGTKFLAENISVARDVIKLQYLFRICDVTKSFSEQVLNKPWTYLSPFCSKVTTVASGIPATSFYLANRLVVTGGSLFMASSVAGRADSKSDVARTIVDA